MGGIAFQTGDGKHPQLAGLHESESGDRADECILHCAGDHIVRAERRTFVRHVHGTGPGQRFE
jgi:hypothetical protein